MDAKEIAELFKESFGFVHFLLDKSHTTTPKEMHDLYWNSPEEMSPAVMEKWEYLVKEATPQLTTPEETGELYQHSPDSMKPALIQFVASNM